MRLTQLAHELETEVDLDRSAASELKKLWQDAVEKIDRFAQSLAMQHPETGTKQEGQEEGVSLDLPSDGSVYDVHLHAEMRAGLLMISQELWGTAAEQHAREVGRVASWIWGSQCMLFQVFRFYATRSNTGVGAMGETDWRQFVQDCRIQPVAASSDHGTHKRPSNGKGELSKAAAVGVFDHFKLYEAKKPGGNRTTNPAEDYALTFFEFLLAVVELAGRVSAAELSNASDMLLSQRVSRFLQQHIACYVPRSDSAMLGATIDSHSVRQFFDQRKKDLHSVYAIFCRGDEGELDSLDRLSQREFSELVAVCKMDKTAGLNALQARKLFNGVQGLTAWAALAEQIERTLAASPGLSVGTRELRAAPAKPIAFALAGKRSDMSSSRICLILHSSRAHLSAVLRPALCFCAHRQ